MHYSLIRLEFLDPVVRSSDDPFFGDEYSGSLVPCALCALFGGGVFFFLVNGGGGVYWAIIYGVQCS